MSLRRFAAAAGAMGLVVLALSAIGVAPALAGGGGCHQSQFTDVKGAHVDIVEMCFTPTVIRIQPGQSVTWSNKDGTEHTVTGAVQSWGTYDSLAAGKAVTYRFRSSGVYPYFCAFHPGMVGAVVVGDGTSSATTTESIVPVVATTPPPATTAPQPVPAVATSHGDSAFWRGAAIAGFVLFLAAGTALALQVLSTRRATARA